MPALIVTPYSKTVTAFRSDPIRLRVYISRQFAQARAPIVLWEASPRPITCCDFRDSSASETPPTGSLSAQQSRTHLRPKQHGKRRAEHGPDNRDPGVAPIAVAFAGNGQQRVDDTWP